MLRRSGRSSILSLGLLCLFFLVAPSFLTAQEFEIVDHVLQDIDLENTRQVDWLEYLWELKNNPLNLNRAEVRDLLRIPFLTPRMAREIVRQRRKRGFRTLEDLKRLPGMSDELFQALKPFVTVSPPPARFKLTYRLQAGLTLPTARGYQKQIYQNPLWVNQRIYFRNGSSLLGGIIWDKDAGEENYFDFGSYHLLWQNRQHQLRLTLGDYYLQYGAGMVYWSPFGLPLYPEILPILRIPEEVLRNNRSASPTGFLRGVNLSKGFGGAGKISFFFSRRQLDATISPSGGSISSLYIAGLHRTANEKSKQNRLEEVVFGSFFEKTFPGGRAQLLFSRNRLQPPLAEHPGQYSFLSLALQAHPGKLVYSAEWALLNLRFPALVNQLYLERANFRYQFTVYYYHPDYFTLRGRALGSFSQVPINKLGTALLLRFSPWKGTRLSAYLHAYRPVRSPEDPAAVRRDYYLSITRVFSHQQISLRFKQKNRPLSQDISGEKEQRYDGLQLTYRYRISPQLTLQSRLESRWATLLPHPAHYQGFSLYHQLDWNLQRHLKLLLRWTTFDVPDYDLRIYEFEPDLPGNFFLQLLNGRGYKLLTLLRWNLSPRLQFDVKWQWRYYPDVREIGSGLDRIERNWLQQFRLSVLWKN